MKGFWHFMEFRNYFARVFYLKIKSTFISTIQLCIMKTINYIFLFAILFAFTTCSPKTNAINPKIPVKIWDKTLGGDSNDEEQDIIATSDGGYIIVGTSSSGIFEDKSEISKGGFDYWVVKINSKGQKVWDKTFGGKYYDEALSVVASTDGGFLIAGTSNSDISGDKTEASKGGKEYDFWIVKINNNGQKIWDKTFGGDGYDFAKSIISTSDGGFVIAGTSTSNISGDKSQGNNGREDCWIIKINSSGQKIWDKTFGGKDAEHINQIITTLDGGFMVSGYVSSANAVMVGNPFGAEKFWLLRINGSGDKVWDKLYYGGSGVGESSIVSTNDGGFIFVGSSDYGIWGDKTEASKGGSDYWVVKINGMGEKDWDKTFGGKDEDSANAIISTSNGEFLIGGISTSQSSGDKTESSRGFSDYWIIKIDNQGNKLWDKTLGGNGKENFHISLVSNSDNSFIIAGTSFSDMSGDKSEPCTNCGYSDYWLVKLGFQ